MTTTRREAPGTTTASAVPSMEIRWFLPAGDPRARMLRDWMHAAGEKLSSTRSGAGDPGDAYLEALVDAQSATGSDPDAIRTVLKFANSAGQPRIGGQVAASAPGADAGADADAARVPPATKVEERRDSYFVPTHPLVGVKERGGGGLEVKVRVDAEELAEAASPNISGQVERWVKLASRGTAPALPGALRRLEIWKRRWLLKVDAATGSLVSGNLNVGAGCGVEVTTIRPIRELPATASDDEQVTLGLEAFGPHDAATSAFSAALRRVSDDLPELVLRKGESFGYPEWLMRLEAARG